jgi:hypothetical protein
VFWVCSSQPESYNENLCQKQKGSNSKTQEGKRERQLEASLTQRDLISQTRRKYLENVNQCALLGHL